MLKLLFLFALGSIYVSIMLSSPEKNDVSILVSGSVVVAYATYRAFLSKQNKYSVYQFFYIFSLLFMGMAPLVQYKQSIETVGGYRIEDATYVAINIIMIATFILVDVVYRYRNTSFSSTVRAEEKKGPSKVKVSDTFLLKTILLAISLVSLVYVIYINQGNIAGMFYRDVLLDRVEIENTTLQIMSGIVRPLAIFAFIFYYKFGTSPVFKVTLFALALISCFPAALARFHVGAYWVPVLITLLTSLNKRRIFGYAYTAGILILFPAFEIFRAMSFYTTGQAIISEFFKRVSEAFTTMSYDSYQSLAFVFQNEFLTYGGQLAGVLGFFIPRTWWEDKPVGTGFTIADQYNLGFENISMNFFGEGYVNFGIIGIFLFAIFLAVFMRYLDVKYWTNTFMRTPLFSVVYLIVLGIFAYIMRGDLIGSFTSTVAVVMSATIVYLVLTGVGRFSTSGEQRHYKYNERVT